MSTSVLGVDGCKGGWCAVAIDPDSLTIAQPQVLGVFRDVIETRADVVCVDIPIGLTDTQDQRGCDANARRLLGPRAPCVFTPPSRDAFPFVDNYWKASGANLKATGRYLNQQGFHFMRKVREVDGAITPRLQSRVYEVHPELCFWALNGESPVLSRKARVVGRHERWQLLQAVLRSLPDKAPKPRDLPSEVWGLCAPDDYIDAVVAAWTAVCIWRKDACRIPENEELDARDLRMEMLYPCK